jgi:hypothetical protein
VAFLLATPAQTGDEPMPKKIKPDNPVAAAPMLVPGESMTIEMFCRRHHFSRRHFYNLPPEDRPKIMKIGGSQRISQAAEAEWAERMAGEAA